MQEHGPKAVFLSAKPERGHEMAAVLRLAGIEVAVFSDLQGGLQEARRGVDLIIYDVDLGQNPTDHIRAFRLDTNLGKVPLLALADRSLSEEDISSLLSAGAMDVLSRPFGPPLLLARVGNMVRIHREEEHLKETEKRYRRIFASSHYGYFLSTREGRFLEVNDALLHMLGYSSREEVLKLRLPTDLYVNPEDRKLLTSLVEKQGFVKDFKVDFKRKDGSRLTILLTANLYRSPDGRTVGFEGFNIPLLDLEPIRPRWMPRWLARSLSRFRSSNPNFMAVSRISELVANQYEKVEELSEGYYCSVWKGRDVLGFEESPLVIKISKSEAINGRLLAEAQALRKLAGHPGVPTLLDVARHRGRTVLVTRYVEGKPLSDILHTLTPRERDRVAYQLMDVVAYLHDHDVVHRDIKPSNIIIRPDGTLVLLDYGIVRQMAEAETSATIIGTRPYMSPEQINGRSERRSDVWGLGVVLYQMYTGRLPFDGNTEIELMENILHIEPPVPRSLNQDLPAPLEIVLIHALRKRPQGRYHSAREMRDDVLATVPGFRDNVVDLLREEEVPVELVP